MFAEDLEDAGLQLQLPRLQCYIIVEEFRNEEWEELWSDIIDRVIKDLNGKAVTADSNAFHGIMTCNVPIGE